jgi:hypothetical protein
MSRAAKVSLVVVILIVGLLLAQMAYGGGMIVGAN